MNRVLPIAVDIENHLQKAKVLIIYGARHVGKATLLNQFLGKSDYFPGGQVE